MKLFIQKLKEQGHDSGMNLLMLMITISLFGIAIASSMTMVTSQFRGTNSMTQQRGRAQVTRTIADMDCCLTLTNLAGGFSNIAGKTCAEINGFPAVEVYDTPDKSSIVPYKTSYSVPLEIGKPQAVLDNSMPARDKGRFLGKWNYSVRCETVGTDDLPESAKYLKILTWRMGNDPLTNNPLETPKEYFQARSCSGELNGSKNCP